MAQDIEFRFQQCRKNAKKYKVALTEVTIQNIRRGIQIQDLQKHNTQLLKSLHQMTAANTRRREALRKAKSVEDDLKVLLTMALSLAEANPTLTTQGQESINAIRTKAHLPLPEPTTTPQPVVEKAVDKLASKVKTAPPRVPATREQRQKLISSAVNGHGTRKQLAGVLSTIK